MRHWELEKSLTKELLESSPDNRWEVFEKCYSRLYRELSWLNQSEDSSANPPPSAGYQDWLDLVGPPPKRIYEVGSGTGEFISYLADCGFECRGTEITRERGEKWAGIRPNLSWDISDGVHLERFEPVDSWDVVISNQVIEHLHPQDLTRHFRGVLSILSKGGRYIFCTPHRSVGPTDISRVFKCDVPMGMHLKEYTYDEISRLLNQAGFRRAYAALMLPRKVQKLLGWRTKARVSGPYLSYLRFVERLVEAVPTKGLRRKAARAARFFLFNPTIWIVAEKG